jgi:carbamoyltransferase
MRKILGISAFYHDSAASLLIDGKVVAAAQEERFTRIKHTSDFPVNAIKYCLEDSGVSLYELDAIVFYDKPFLKFERLIETYYAFAPKGLKSFITSIPVWLNEKLFLKRRILKELESIEFKKKHKLKLLFSEHHLSHAASCFYPSNFKSAAILTIDGVGEWCTTSIGFGDNKKIRILKELSFPHSVGLLYSSFTYFLGFKVNSGEYKLMGLAPYGNADSDETRNFISTIKSKLISIKDDGSIWMNQSFFNYAFGLRMVNDKKWKDLFGFERRNESSRIEQKHCNLALAIQLITEEIVIKMAKEAKRITSADNICLAGGVALNCVANGKLAKENIFKEIYIQPASGDAGGALGASLAIQHLYFLEDRNVSEKNDSMNGAYLGPEYADFEVIRMIKSVKAKYTHYTQFNDLTKFIAKKLSEKFIVGWFQGRMEFGPRALGNRSILADATDDEMQKRLNLKIKFREGFRPFAPAILSEFAHQYFELNSTSPYMLFVAPIKDEFKNQLPLDYNELSMFDKLYHKRSAVQAITHVDFTARIQTVHKETNPAFHQLISDFHEITSCPILINTSFNVRGEPIVNTPLEAYSCFMATDMDYLVIGNFVFCKTEQINWQNKEIWQKNFQAD